MYRFKSYSTKEEFEHVADSKEMEILETRTGHVSVATMKLHIGGSVRLSALYYIYVSSTAGVLCGGTKRVYGTHQKIRQSKTRKREKYPDSFQASHSSDAIISCSATGTW